MGITFHGPWSITTTNALLPFTTSLEVSGSTSADGSYAPGPGQTIEVSGDEWSLVVRMVGRQETMRQATTFDRVDGLQVVLISSSDAPPHYLRLVCRCLDPDVNPDPAPSLYDFTLPEVAPMDWPPVT